MKLIFVCQSKSEGLTLETSAFQSLYGGQFTLSTLLINQIFVLYIYIYIYICSCQKIVTVTFENVDLHTRKRQVCIKITYVQTELYVHIVILDRVVCRFHITSCMAEFRQFW